METIFLTIAAYRDLELRLTLKDCFAKAEFPERLKFGICWQRDEDEHLGSFATHPQVRLYSIPYQESKGACWARSKTQEFYQGETYWMQIDSHTRFVQNWDTLVIDEFKKCEDLKAILSTYPKGYKIDFFTGQATLDGSDTAFKLNATKIHPDYFICQQSVNIITSTTEKPGLSRFTAGGLIFGPGKVVEDVPYDPNYYFLGEEISFAVRAYTHGYNIYYPSKNIVFHHYRGKGDSGPQGQAWKDQKDWGKQHEESQRRFKALVVDKDFAYLGKYGPGNARSIEEYERYSGLCFKTRDVHPDAISGKDPNPYTVTDFNWTDQIQALEIDFSGVHKLLDNEETSFWCVALFDADGKQILRHDVRDERLLKDSGNSHLWLQYVSDRIPVEIMVWPYYKQGAFKRKHFAKIPPSWYRSRKPTGDLEGAYDADDSVGYWFLCV